MATASAGARAGASASFLNANGIPNTPAVQTGAVRASNSAQTTFRVNSVRTGQSSARSYADLSTGALGVEAFINDTEGASRAFAQFSDVLTFNLPTGVNTAIIPLKFLVNGSLGRLSGRTGSASYSLAISPGVQASHAFLASAILYFGGGFAQTGSPFGHITSFNAGGVTGDFVALRGVNYTISAQLTGSNLADYYHTATFSFPSLPPGVTYTSASGAFLREGKTEGGVPEPATWAMMLAGFFSLGAMLRARRVREAGL